MTFYVDAWLDHPQPYVQVKNKQNRKVVADFSSEELKSAIEQGDICLSDFFDTSVAAQLELIKSLLLLRCCVDMGKEIKAVCSTAVKCRQTPNSSFTPPTSYH
jgi:hypothetical protein